MHIDLKRINLLMMANFMVVVLIAYGFLWSENFLFLIIALAGMYGYNTWYNYSLDRTVRDSLVIAFRYALCHFVLLAILIALTEFRVFL